MANLHTLRASSKACVAQVLQKNSPIPGDNTEVFRTAYDNQEAMLFDIYEGEHEKSVKNKLIASMTLENIRLALKGEVAADINFRIDNVSQTFLLPAYKWVYLFRPLPAFSYLHLK